MMSSVLGREDRNNETRTGMVPAAKALMTKDELADRLNHLDPGSTTQVEAADLAKMFGASTLTQEIIEAVEAFAVERRCSFSHDVSGRHPPTFEKDDVF